MMADSYDSERLRGGAWWLSGMMADWHDSDRLRGFADKTSRVNVESLLQLKILKIIVLS